MVKVTEEDREAAWPHRPSCYQMHDRTDWMAGKYDKAAPVIRDFAAHREAARAKALEEAAAEVDQRQEEWAAVRGKGARRISVSSSYTDGALSEAEVIATAIRNIKEG
ncbi:hypothetical protein [Novosphingobium sp. PY1]|uniref:Uncharacterized protein n=1 Tax=Ochrobactrum sp. PW1 TaxID=1882222 RepID=A0A292GNI4_9HYPH|nr:hypothetical protein [Novosphingobium sp. PY1]BBA74438.1 hypothetical protein [Ochrobactrum sp. PW1]GFM29287.1 uncharacterized protein PY1_contig-07-213 [Novosphingobium sp. PY1]